MKILELSATELAKKIKAGEITSEEAAKASLEQIAKEDQKIRAYLTVDEEKVLTRARSGCGDPRRKIYRAAYRCPDRSERQYLYKGNEDDMCVKDPGKLRPVL